MTSSAVVIAIAAIYLGACLVVGMLPGRKSSDSAAGYVAGDRSLGPLVMYFITGATIFSAFAFLGAPGFAYERGAAAMSMGVLRINEALPHLIAVYRGKDEQDMVRAFAVVALGVLADPSPTPKLSRFAIDNNYSIAIDPLGEVLSIL